MLGDSLEIMAGIEDCCVDMIFADPPYFLSNGGITCQAGKMVSVNKGDWDVGRELGEVHSFNMGWLKQCKRLLKPDGTIWVSGTHHNIHSIGIILQELGYKILNNVVWFKPNASPNLSCRYFTHSYETIIWAAKSEESYYTFNYKLMKEINGGKQMRDVWEIPTTPHREKKFGNHPTQKPLRLLERIILASTKKGDCILDPFNGSGTTGIAAARHFRNYVGLDMNENYLEVTAKRFTEERAHMRLEL